MTSFVGRRSEMAEVRQLLSVARMVTLIGPGGVGKTRLALRVAADARRPFGGEVRLVELDRLRDPALVADAVAETLGLRLQPSESAVVALEAYLFQRSALLVLDNCEHLVDGVAAVASTLLSSCPQLRILATSREPLCIQGEVVLPVPPLTVPNPRWRPSSPEKLTRYESVTLFVERAASMDPGFSVAENNQDAVAEICRRLDGLPLAIELAAARLRALSAQDIALRLTDCFRLLTTGLRGAPSRQQTLESCIQWSYNLCSPEEQVLWARLSVFTGGFELDAVEGICAGEGLVVENILGLVVSLVDKSILLAESGRGVVRYRLLESIREYGGEKLLRSEGYETLRRRHRAWYADLVARVNLALGVGVVAWRQGDPKRAAALLAQSLRLKREMDEPLDAAWSLEALAWIAAGEQDFVRSGILLGAADSLFHAANIRVTVYPGVVGDHEQCERQTHDALGDAAFQARFGVGAGLNVDDAISYALGEKPEVAAASKQARAAETPLTRREQQVAQLVARGLTNKDIADQLVISPRTAEAHVEHILLKLGAVSRSQIAAWVAEGQAEGDARH
jgi:predicted ATPase/DNA-binding CsgD family transcriptional regulator